MRQANSHVLRNFCSKGEMVGAGWSSCTTSSNALFLAGILNEHQRGERAPEVVGLQGLCLKPFKASTGLI